MLQGHFLPSIHGNLFVTQIGDISADQDTAILCLPSIVEELNLARAVVAKQAHYFAANQIPCFILDYFGTGDSAGEFEEATCDIWLDNIIETAQWLMAEHNVKKIILWGIRFGGLLMFAHQQKLHDILPITHQLVWKPITNGKQFAGQFIRIKQSNAMMNNTGEKINWRNQVLAGEHVEIAGYQLTANMLNSIEALKVDQTLTLGSPLAWLDLATEELGPAVARYQDSWQTQHATFNTLKTGPFWQVPEIFDEPELYSLSYQAVSGAV
ncbi:alpha/beta hydrolase family protein [Flocculibacter collagenilyticus]|uniref:hypothetical protein n=1 Tax=Flocculibacter collagenilyticus TaxID=2744479 RepID=UPI0018F47E0B|nr:hypothetical protein [Flocculibacter collagenilyticus]